MGLAKTMHSDWELLQTKTGFDVLICLYREPVWGWFITI